MFQIDRKHFGGQGDLVFLERIFMKLLLNFTWWVNRKDASGRNIFQGGFLGLDNIGVFDRSAPLPGGGHLNQSDSTSWMAMFSLTMMRIALELALHNRAYEDMATKFFEHFLYIARAMTDIGGAGLGLWDEQDEFYYDVLDLPDHRMVPLKVHSMVGLIPMFAVETLEPEMLDKLPSFTAHMEWFLNYRPDLAALISEWTEPGRGKRRLLSLLRGHRLKALLRRMLDERGFFSDYGVRSLSRYHLEHPYVFWLQGQPITGEIYPRGGGVRSFRRQFQLARPRLVPAELSASSSPAAVSPLLHRRLQSRMPQRFGPIRHHQPGGLRVDPPPGEHLPARRAGTPAGIRRRWRNFKHDPHFRDYLLFHEYLPRRRRPRPAAPPTRPAGPASSPSCCNRVKRSNRPDVAHTLCVLLRIQAVRAQCVVDTTGRDKYGHAGSYFLVRFSSMCLRFDVKLIWL